MFLISTLVVAAAGGIALAAVPARSAKTAEEVAPAGEPAAVTP
jgi:hypothetical protein